MKVADARPAEVRGCAFLTEAELQDALTMLEQVERNEAWRVGSSAVDALFGRFMLMAALEAVSYQVARIVMELAERGAPESRLFAAMELIGLRAIQIADEIDPKGGQDHEQIGHA
jgi:hypothetical protein